MSSPRLAALVAIFALGLAPTLSGCGPSGFCWTTPLTGMEPTLLGVWGSGPLDVWAVGGSKTSNTPLLLHNTGKGFAPVDPPAGAKGVLYWAFGFGPKDVWFSGDLGLVMHWDGKALSVIPTDDNISTFYGIWGASPTDVWAVGGVPDKMSSVLRFAGTRFSITAANEIQGGSFFKVWGSSASDVYFVGQHGTLMHWNGTVYSTIALGKAGVTAMDPLITVAGTGESDIYIVGGLSPLVVHFDGTSWAPLAGLDLTGVGDLTGVATAANGDLALSGFNGTRLLRRNNVWRNDSKLGLKEDLHAVWMSGPDDVYAVGGQFFAETDGTIVHGVPGNCP